MTAAYIAAGLDPKRSILFNQSQVSAHAERRGSSTASRAGGDEPHDAVQGEGRQGRENASVGLYAYPNLMAADILAYRATHVPVGEDQKQHLELARDIAQKFNNDYRASIEREGFADGIFFPQPEPVITGPATQCRCATAEDVEVGRLRPVAHQSDRRRRHHRPSSRRRRPIPSRCPARPPACAARPEADNLVGIYAALDGRAKADVLAEFGSAQFSTFKKALAELAAAAGADGGGDEAADGGPGRDRPHSRRRRGAGARHRRPRAAKVKDIVGLIRS